MRAETTPPGAGATRGDGFDRLGLSADIRVRLPDGRAGTDGVCTAGAGGGDELSLEDEDPELPLDPELDEPELGGGSFLGTAC